MPALLLIASKDVRQRIRDGSAIAMALIAPFGLALIFSLVIGGAAGPTTFRYAVADEDGGSAARTFTTEVLGRAEATGSVTVRHAASAAEARALVEDGAVAAAFLLPAGFSDEVAAGRPAAIRVVGDVDAPTSTAVARAIAGAYAAEVNSVRLAVGTVTAGSGGLDPSEAAALAERLAADPRNVSIDDRTALRRELDAGTFFAAGMTIFFLFFTVQFGISSLFEERTTGTLGRLLAAPVTRPAIVGGKLLASGLVGVLSTSVLILASSLLLGAQWGHPGGVAILVGAGVAAATGVMALVASAARSMEGATNAQAVVAVVLGLVGGTFFPLAQAGRAVELLSLATPHAWFMRGLGDLAAGGGPADVLGPAAAILVFAAAAGGLASTRLGKLVRA